MALDKVRDLGTLVWELFSTARRRFRTMSQSSHAASSISQDSYVHVQYALITVLLTPEVHLPLRSLSAESTTATLCCTSVTADGRECCCLSLVPCSTSRRFILSDVLHWLYLQWRLWLIHCTGPLYFVIFDIRVYSGAQPWASECPDVKNYKWQLNPVWHRMLYSCTHMATVGFIGLRANWTDELICWAKPSSLTRISTVIN